MKIEERIIGKTIEAVKALYGQDITADILTLQETRKEFEGDLTLVTFPLTRISRQSPEQTGEIIGAWLREKVQEVAAFNVIKGFLNLVLADGYWINAFASEVTRENFGFHPPKDRTVMVEYASPNTNKPLHLGHIRNILLGYSVAEIYKAWGCKVIKANLINDRGIHICKSMLAWQKFGNNETPQSAGLKGDHLVGKYYVIFDKEYKKEIDGLVKKGISEEEAKKTAPIIVEAQEMLVKWEQQDPEVRQVWKMMNGWVYEGFNETYKALGVDFDRFYYESDTYLLGKDIVEEGLSKNVFFKKEDGSVWVDLTFDGLDQKLLLRSDGTSVYMTQDLGTAQLKYDDHKMDQSVYVVGNEQDYHFKVLFLILEKMGRKWAKGLYHLSYGMVDLPTGKMKSREGTVVDGDDIISEMTEAARLQSEELGKIAEFREEDKQELYNTIGLGALKYYLLKVDPKKRLLFDPNESIDLQGHTGPFIQYTYARIRSLLKKAGFTGNVVTPAALVPNEKEVVVQLCKFPAVIEESALLYNPAILANYLYELAKIYNKFYHDEPVLKAGDPDVLAFRLHLSACTASVIGKGMQLLGIRVPERM